MLCLGSRGNRGLMPSPISSQNALAAVLQQSQLAALATRAAGGSMCFFFKCLNLAEIFQPPC